MDLQKQEQDLARAVIEAADSISMGLGYVGPGASVQQPLERIQ